MNIITMDMVDERKQVNNNQGAMNISEGDGE